MPIRSSSLCIAAAVAFGACGGPVWAQTQPCQIASQRELNVATQQQVEAEAARIAGLITQDGGQLAWNAALQYFDCQGVTPAFRRSFAQGALEGLTAASKGDAKPAMFAIAIGGLAGGTAIEADVLRPNLTNTERPPSVRYAAARAYRPVIGGLVADNAAVANANRLINEVIAPALTTEQNPQVAAALLLATGQAAGSSVEPTALLAIAEGVQAMAVQERAVGSPEAWAGAIAVAMQTLRPRLIDEQAARRLSQQTRIEIAAGAGEAIAFVRRVLAEEIPTDERTIEALRQLALQSEDVLTLTQRSFGPQTNSKVLGEGFDASIEAGAIGPFAAAADQWIGAQGVLARPPFGLDPARFRAE